MNVVVNSATDKKEVTSKYFTKYPMDESLSDFQEAKKSHSGPKSSSANIKKPRKVAKKPKGQRDIRTALKSKKNDLVAYTEKFDAVCKKVGVDVDTEDLQLAIALSKSLQTESEFEDCSKQISSQERVKKIRTTLQEYGFKVPETKIRPIKKIKKQRKDYLLISKTTAEKAQTISDKYSQILFTNVDKLNNCNQDIEVPYFSLFNISTNILYEDIKQNNVYYIDNLVEKSSNNGCLLRDWNKIPGRPASPKLIEDSAMNFSEIECSQEELDCVLSGPLRQVKKTLSLKRNIKEKLQNDFNSNANSKNLVENKEIPHIVIEMDEEKTSKVDHGVAHRSCSPDIFDDEESVIECPPTPMIQEKTIETMDLTECINNIVPKNQHNTFTNSQMCQRNGKDVTKRKSNDFMDLTECVATSSQPIHVNIDFRENPYDKECIVKEKNEDILDLTQSSNSLDSLPEIHFGNNENLEDTVILSSDDYKGVKIKHCHLGNKSNANTVYDLTQDNEIEPEGNLSVLKQRSRSNSTTDIEVVEDISRKVSTNIGDTNDSNQIKVDDKEPEKTSKLNSSSTDTNVQICDESYLSTNKNASKESNVEKTHLINLSVMKNSQVHDLNENHEKYNPDFQLSNSIHEERGEVFENYSFDHSMNSSNDTSRKSTHENQECKELSRESQLQNVDIDDGTNEKEMWHKEIHVKDNDNIDLTQSSNSSIDKMVDDGYGLEHFPSNKDNDNLITLPLETDRCKESSLTCNSVKNNNNIAEYKGELSGENNAKGTDNVDLTQSSNTSTEKMEGSCHNYGSDHSSDSNHSDKTIILEDYKYSSPRYRHSLRSKDISIDYDDFINADEYNNGINSAGSSHIETSEGATDDIQASQNTEVFEIIDNELDYSLHRSRRENFGDDGLEILDHVPYPSICESDKLDERPLPMDTNDNETGLKPVTPKKNIKARNIKTPENRGYIIKYDATPMPNYEAMTSPERIRELEKYGLKPIKRKRAIQLLTHIYNQTHPTIESIEQMQSPSKRFKKNTTPPRTPRKILLETTRSNLDILENGWDIFEVTNETPELKEIECAVEDWVFQKREKAKSQEFVPDMVIGSPPITSWDGTYKAKCGCPGTSAYPFWEKGVHSCRVPLHVAFHNYVSCRRGLREAILRYEPIEIDVVHKQLVSYGHRYDPRDRGLREAILRYEPIEIDVVHKQLLSYGHRYDPRDLLRFMDKKCITVKTNDNTKNK